MPNQNYEEGSKVLELMGALKAEGVEPQSIAICFPYKNQLQMYEEELNNSQLDELLQSAYPIKTGR